MPAHQAEEQLDGVEGIGTCVIPGRVDLAIHSLPLEQLEETLGHGVVVTVFATTLAAGNLVIVQESLPLVAGELAAVIGGRRQTWRAVCDPCRSRLCAAPAATTNPQSAA